MFTGIVRHTGYLQRARTTQDLLRLQFHAPHLARELRRGDSVAVNGVCLTVVGARRRRFSVEVVEETLARTDLRALGPGDRVNLEPAARLSDRLGGHLVQGHVDGVAEALEVHSSPAGARVWWGADPELLRYVVTKGSVALDGVSLTVANAEPTRFEVALVPHTLDSTTLGEVRPGMRANLEIDVIAKYVEGLLPGRRAG